MQIPAHTTIRRPRRALACLALLVALLASAALSAGAFARPASGHRATCTASRHSKHGAGRHCAKRHAKKTRGGAHKSKKPAVKSPAPTPKLTPAVCEDGSAPAHSTSGSYTCEDGSEPACEDGSDPLRPSSASAPMCRVAREDPPLECGIEPNGECSVELACEDAEEAAPGPQGCEHGSAFEEESETGA